MTNLLTLREKVEKIIRANVRSHGRGGTLSFTGVENCAERILTDLASGSGDHAGLRRLADEAADFGVPAQVDPAVLNALLAENAALRADLAKTECDYSELRDSYDAVSNKLCVERAHGSRETKRSTEAERNLAEAVGLLDDARRRLVSVGDHFGAGKITDFLTSKEAERG